MKRTISQNHPAVAETLTIGNRGNVREWLREMAIRHSLRWLLAHADDGVIWGENRDDGLVISHDVTPGISPPLRVATLRQARLFSATGELQLWRDDDEWKACLIRVPRTDEPATFTESIDETQILWGGTARQLENRFTLLSDGGQGLRHTVPLTIEERADGDRPLRLHVRHYLGEDDLGFVTIVASRLVDLSIISSRN